MTNERAPSGTTFLFRRRHPSEVPAREGQAPRHTDGWTRADRCRASLHRRPALFIQAYGSEPARKSATASRTGSFQLPTAGTPRGSQQKYGDLPKIGFRVSAFHGTTPCILRDSRLLAHPEAASNCSSLRVSFAPNRASTSSLIARLPPARADSADVWDNLVIDRANSALVRL